MSQESFFDQFSNQWWSETGPFEILHKMNPLRINFTQNVIKKYFSKNNSCVIQALDVGCGGGIACESLARLGIEVTGIDVSEKAILLARSHALDQRLSIQYECADLQNIEKAYDLITCFEVIEHVANLEFFIATLVKKINMNGIIVLSTLNRTISSYLVGILGAEYIMHKVPIGTHSWYKFIEPSEIVALMENSGMKVLEMKGINYSILKKKWFLGGGLSVNYLVAFKKCKL